MGSSGNISILFVLGVVNEVISIFAIYTRKKFPIKLTSSQIENVCNIEMISLTQV